MQMLNATLGDISSNARIKFYPTHSLLQVVNAPIFRKEGYEKRERKYSVPPKGKALNPVRSLESSRIRARAAIRDIALCNEFTHFFTLTLSPEEIDRYDIAEIERRVKNFLRNISQRKEFRYLLVPEFHQDGAVHFHGLCILGSVRLVRAIDPHSNAPISTQNRQAVYNCPEWTLGFSTFIPLDECRERVANYICKYLSKGETKIFGKWYWASRDLVKHPEKALVAGGIDYHSFLAANPELQQFPLYQDVCMVVCKVQEKEVAV